MNRFCKAGVTILITLAVLTVPAQAQFPSDQPSASAGETAEINFYIHATQIGVVAKRTIRDRTGQIAREVFYGSNAIAEVAQTEKDLRVRSISVYYNDSSGRVGRVEHWETGQRTPRVEHNAYSSTGELSRKWYVEPDGVKRYEMRFGGSKQTTDLYYDDTGSYLTSLRGQLVSDTDLPHGWGITTAGIACAISLSTEHGRFEEIAVWVNIKNVASETVTIGNLPEPSFEVRDAAGTMIPVRDAASDVKRETAYNPAQLYGQLLERNEAGYMYPGYRLSSYFNRLLPGKYTIRVRQSVPERNLDLISNDVTVFVL